MAEILIGIIKTEGVIRGKISADVKLSGRLTTSLPDGGYERGYAEGETVGYEKGKTDGVAEGYAQGKQAEWNTLWDGIQNFGNKVDYTGTFRDKGWTDETFNPKYPIKPTTADYTFMDTGITDFTREGIVLDFSLTTVARGTFNGTRNTEMKLPTIDFSKVAYSSENFRNFWGKELSVILPETFAYNTSFLENYYLERLTITGVVGKTMNMRDSSLLSDESVRGIIDCLKDLTGATAQTLTFHKDVGAKLTDAQKATITAKNWTLVY